MTLFDVNILVYAVNREAPQHEMVRDWIASLVHGDEDIGLCWEVLSGFVRIATNPRTLANRLSREDAIASAEYWIKHPSTRIVRPVADHWTLFHALLEESQAIGNLVTDAHLAAIAIGNGAKLASCDVDFAKFSKLRWVNPLAA